jgi:hypothetical protein
MFIPDPNFFRPGYRVKKDSRIPDPDPHPHIRILTEKIVSVTHPGSRGQKGTGSRVRIRNTAKKTQKKKQVKKFHVLKCWMLGLLFGAKKKWNLPDMDEIAEPLPRILVPIRLVSWHVKGPTRISIIRTMNFFLLK